MENSYSFQAMPQAVLVNFLDKKDSQFFLCNGTQVDEKMIQPIQMVDPSSQLQSQISIPSPQSIQAQRNQLQPQPQIQQSRAFSFPSESVGSAFTPESFVSLSPPQSMGNEIKCSTNTFNNNNYYIVSPNVLHNLPTGASNTPSCPDLTESPFTSMNGSVDNLSILSTPSQADSMRKMIYDENSNIKIHANPETLDFEGVNNNFNNYQIFEMMPKQMLQMDIKQPPQRVEKTVSSSPSFQTVSNQIKSNFNPVLVSQTNNNSKPIEKTKEKIQKARLTIDTGKKKKYFHKRDLSLTGMTANNSLMSPVQAAKYPLELSSEGNSKNSKESTKTPLFQTMVLDFSSNKKSIKVHKNLSSLTSGSDGCKSHRKTKSESRFSGIKRRNISDLSISTSNTPLEALARLLNTPVSTASIMQLCGNNFTPVNTHFQFSNIATPTVEQVPKNTLNDFEFRDELDDEELLNFDLEASFSNSNSPEEVLNKLFSQESNNPKKKETSAFGSDILQLLPTLEELEADDKDVDLANNRDKKNTDILNKAVNSIFENSSNGSEALKNSIQSFSSPIYSNNSFMITSLNDKSPIPENQLPTAGTFKMQCKENTPVVKVVNRRGRKQSTEYDPSKIYGCTMCTRKFKRQEHLKRHFRSLHTGEKPFNCEICNKKFSRNDNLGQHMKIHTS